MPNDAAAIARFGEFLDARLAELRPAGGEPVASAAVPPASHAPTALSRAADSAPAAPVAPAPGRGAQGETADAAQRIFSAPMPALLWIAALNFTTLFWVDKICFLRLYRSDTLPSDDSLARLLRFFLPLALLWHFLFATWAFSNPSILRGTGTGFANSLTIVGKANEQRSTLSNVLDVVFTSRLSNCPVSTIFFFLSAIAVVGFMIVKAYFLDKLLGCFAACKDFLSRKGEDNPDFHEVLTTVRLHSIVDGEDGQLPVLTWNETL